MVRCPKSTVGISSVDTFDQELFDIYKIDGERLATQGKGETEPVQDNNGPDGKAQNRQVEFIKQ